MGLPLESWARLSAAAHNVRRNLRPSRAVYSDPRTPVLARALLSEALAYERCPSTLSPISCPSWGT